MNLKYLATTSVFATLATLLFSSGSHLAAQVTPRSEGTNLNRGLLTEAINSGEHVKFGTVQAKALFVRTGIQATPGQVFVIQSMGMTNLASDGPYITNANGTITTAPPVDSGAYQWFTDNASPVGTPPVVGMKKYPLGGTQLDSAPFGALVAGFSSIPNPTSLADFPGGFHLVGTSKTAKAPAFGGYLFFAVNDIVGGTDNAGYYLVRISF